MRVVSREKKIGCYIEVWLCTWNDSRVPERRRSSLCFQHRAQAEVIYHKKEKQGRMPVLVRDWIACWAF